MLRKFKIKIDGKEYLVEMEEIGAVQPAAAAVPEAVPKSQPQAAPITNTAEPVAVFADPLAKDAMEAPMPGTILRILVAAGEQVTENQPLLILEAMKMENEVVAKQAGVVQEIFVQPGTTVNAGDALIAIG